MEPIVAPLGWGRLIAAYMSRLRDILGGFYFSRDRKKSLHFQSTLHIIGMR